MSGQRADQGLWLKDLRWRGLARAIGKPSLQLYLDCPTRTANFLQRLGFSGTAERWLRRVYAAHPYDLALGEYLSNLMFQNRGHEFCEGTVERGRFLMQVFMGSYPSSRVIEAYFRTLKIVLLARAQPAVQGQVVVGLGAGRCGSTTLAAVLHSIDGSISTHERTLARDRRLRSLMDGQPAGRHQSLGSALQPHLAERCVGPLLSALRFARGSGARSAGGKGNNDRTLRQRL